MKIHEQRSGIFHAGVKCRWLGLFAISYGSVACTVGVGTYDEGTEGSPVDSTQQPILNGDVSANPRVVQVWRNINGWGTCSGTLLRSDIVLTARHCVGSGGGISWPEHWIKTSTGSWVRISEKDQLIEHPDKDLAVMRLDSRVSIDGEGRDYYTPLHDGSVGGLENKNVQCFGYGERTCGANNSGTLREAVLTVDSASSGTLRYEPNDDDELLSAGDSGGPCFRNGELVGVTRTASCTVANQTPVTTHFEWIREQINELQTHYWFDFDRSSDLGYWEFRDLSGSDGGPSNWFVRTQNGGSLRQTTNIRNPGTLALLEDFVIGDGLLHMQASSQDDDVAGIVFRYQNDNNYYRCTIWEHSGGGSGIYKVKNGTSSKLAGGEGGSWGFQSMSVYLDGDEINCAGMTVNDDEWLDGRVGLISNGMQGIDFRWFDTE